MARKKIAVVNQKGGVGKTTLVLETAYAFAKAGKTVLIVDLDPQGNVTSMLTGHANHEHGIFDILLRPKEVKLSQVMKEATDVFLDIAVLPGDFRLGTLEGQIQSLTTRERHPQTLLKRILQPIEKEFDLILIDTPPVLNILTENALIAADAYIVPTAAAQFSKKGIENIKIFADGIVEDGSNASLEFLGIVLTSFQKGGANAIRRIVDFLSKTYGKKLIPVKIPDSVKVTESQESSVPVGALDPDCPVAVGYRELKRYIEKETQA